MNFGYKKQLLAMAVSAIVIIGLVSCPDILEETFEDLLGYPALALLISLIPLYFLKEAVYKAWRTFALVALPLIILWIINTPESCSGIPCVLADRESVSMVGSFLFVLISYITIIVKSRASEKSGWKIAGKVTLVFLGVIAVLYALAFLADYLQ